jgi:hypothetical protein
MKYHTGFLLLALSIFDAAVELFIRVTQYQAGIDSVVFLSLLSHALERSLARAT